MTIATTISGDVKRHKEVSEGNVWCCGEYAECEYLIDVLSIANLELGLRWLHDRANNKIISYDYVSAYPPVPPYPATSNSYYGKLNVYHVSREAMALELGLRWLHDRANELHCTAGCQLEGYDTCLHYRGMLCPHYNIQSRCPNC